jgi:hypothetical protein
MGLLKTRGKDIENLLRKCTLQIIVKLKKGRTNPAYKPLLLMKI